MDKDNVLVFPDAVAKSAGIDPGLLALLNNNGGFGNNNWIWVLFLWMIWGNNGWGNNGFGGNNGTGYLANQMSNDAGRDLLLQAINGRADAISQIATITNTGVETVKNGIFALQSAIQNVGTQVGMSGLEVQNAIALGNAGLSRQLCECCCENRLAIANQTSALQAQMAQNDANIRLQLAQLDGSDKLAMCQQTNQLGSQADRNTNTILGAIANQNTLITKEFCDLKAKALRDTAGEGGQRAEIAAHQADTEGPAQRFQAYEQVCKPVCQPGDSLAAGEQESHGPSRILRRLTVLRDQHGDRRFDFCAEEAVLCIDANILCPIPLLGGNIVIESEGTVALLDLLAHFGPVGFTPVAQERRKKARSQKYSGNHKDRER